MKIKFLACGLVLIVLASVARAQVFNEGENFTYYFASLPLTYPPAIQLADYLAVNTGSGPLTSVMRWEIFDSLPSGVAVASGIWSGAYASLAGIPVGTWQDEEGSFRISVLSGSQLINSATIYLSSAAPTGGVYRLTVIPAAVPEPSAFVLLLVGSGVGLLWARGRTRTA